MIQFLQQRAKSQGTRFAKDRSQSIFIESGSLFLKKSVLRSLLACKKNLENEIIFIRKEFQAHGRALRRGRRTVLNGTSLERLPFCNSFVMFQRTW